MKVDQSRTTDIASVLRVPGTANRKDPDNPRPVKLLCMGEPTSYADLHGILAAHVMPLSGAPSAALAALPSNLTTEASGDHWFDRLSPDDKNACLAEMLQVGAVIALADTSDSAPAPNWRTVLAACARSGAPDAYNLCRAWAQVSQRFDAGNFDTRWESYARD